MKSRGAGRWGLLVVALSACLMWAASTRAQGESDSAASARQAFEQGVTLVQQQRWSEAIEAFRRSNELEAKPNTWFNLAIALYHGGQMAQALEAAERFLELAGDDVTDADRRQVEELSRLAGEGVGVVELELSPEHASLTVDGAAHAGVGEARRLRLDVGSHELVAHATGFQQRSVTVELAAGQRLQHTLHLKPIAQPVVPVAETVAVAGPRIAPSGPPRDDDAGWLSSPWFWAVVGAVAVSGSITAGLMLQDERPKTRADTGERW